MPEQPSQEQLLDYFAGYVSPQKVKVYQLWGVVSQLAGVLALGAALLLPACSEGETPSAASPPPAASPSPEAGAPTATEVREGARLTLSLDRSSYRPGETITVLATVENSTQDPVTYTLRNLGDPAIYVRLDFPGGATFLRHPDDPEIMQPAINTAVLEPGETFTRTVFWDQLLGSGPDARQAPPGEYTITAEFFPGGLVYGEEPVPFTAFTASLALELVAE